MEGETVSKGESVRTSPRFKPRGGFECRGRDRTDDCHAVMTFDEIAKRLGISRQRAYQVCVKAEKKIAKALGLDSTRGKDLAEDGYFS